MTEALRGGLSNIVLEGARERAGSAASFFETRGFHPLVLPRVA